MRVRDMLGKEVLDATGNRVGRIHDLKIDLINNSLRQIFIRVGFSHGCTISADDVVTAGEKIIIRKRKEDLQKVCTFTSLGIRRSVLFNV